MTTQKVLRVIHHIPSYVCQGAAGVCRSSILSGPHGVVCGWKSSKVDLMPIFALRSHCCCENLSRRTQHTEWKETVSKAWRGRRLLLCGRVLSEQGRCPWPRAQNSGEVWHRWGACPGRFMLRCTASGSRLAPKEWETDIMKKFIKSCLRWPCRQFPIQSSRPVSWVIGIMN